MRKNPCENCISTCTGCKGCPSWLSWFSESWKECVLKIKGEEKVNSDFEVKFVRIR